LAPAKASSATDDTFAQVTMSKVDPGLKYLASRSPADLQTLSAVSWRAETSPSRHVANVMIEVDGDGSTLPQGLLDIGFKPRTRAGNVFTGDMPRDAIRALERLPGLRRAEAARPMRRELEEALPEARVVGRNISVLPHRGAGVIVGIIDHGIDYRHQSFRNEDGTSRILAIWDQRLEPRHDQGEASPAEFGYGVEYTREVIDAALQSSDPISRVRHIGIDPFHGTHVAGIAAGNGRPANNMGEVRFVGVAPEADLVVVANTRGDGQDPGSLGDSADTLDAIHYILRIAERRGQAVAINLSQGDNLGPHDGTSLLEVGIEHLIAGPGRVLVKSAGNEGDKARHASGTLPESGVDDVRIAVAPHKNEVIVDIWYRGADRIGVQIASPNATETTDALWPTLNTAVTLSNGNSVFVDADLNDPGNGHHRTFIALQAGQMRSVEQGNWIFRLKGNGQWHAWIQLDPRATLGTPPHALFLSHLNRESTITIPGTSPAVIAVASYVSSTRFTPANPGTLSGFSSHGPTLGRARAPWLAAPGEEITAPQPDDHFAERHGTSMAAAMVTGAVALMLQKCKTLTATDIRTRLKTSARSDKDTEDVPNEKWGFGKLDVQKALE
jgi:subtilisin family serine protease